MQPRSVRTSIFVALGMALGACGTDSTDPKDAGTYSQTDSSITGDDGCDGQATDSTERRVRYQAATVQGDAECLKQDQLRTCQSDGTWSEWSGDYTVESCKVEGMASCDGMPHGTMQTRPRYETMTVAAGATCKKQDQTRACEDGTWSAWSGNFTFEMCTVDGATSCGTSPDGAKEERKRWESLTVPFGTECKMPEVQTRECKKGTWSAWTGSFTQENCRVLDALSCGNTPHLGEEKRTLFKASLVEANEKCESEEQTRKCSNGTWSVWSGTYAAASCDIKGQRRCGETPHNQSEKRTLFEKATVPFGSQCNSQEQTRTCTDGTFGAWTGTFAATACTVEAPKACDGIAHGGTRARSRFQSATVPFNTTCVSENQTSTCNNGVWSAYSGTFAAETCSVAQPLSCGNVAHGGTRTQTRFKEAAPEFGTTCVSETQTATCNNGMWSAWSGTYSAETCVVAPPASCEGTASGTKETRERFENASVAAGMTCRKQAQTRTCTNGKWSAWTGTYVQLTCKVRGRDCSLGLGGGPDILDGASESRVRYEASFPAAACKAETQTRLCTNGTFAPWNGTFKAVACAPLPATGTGVVSCRQPSDTDPKCREWRGTNLGGYKSECTAGDWDTTRGCPTEGTTIGKCSGTLAGTSVVIAEFFYEGNATFEATTCRLGLFRTWTDL